MVWCGFEDVNSSLAVAAIYKSKEKPRGGGFRKTKKFKEMSEVELEYFTEGWGALKKIPYMGRYGNFMELNIMQSPYVIYSNIM